MFKQMGKKILLNFMRKIYAYQDLWYLVCAYRVYVLIRLNMVLHIIIILGWLRREKTFLQGFRQSEIQTCLLRYRDYLENLNFTRSKSRYDTLQYPNNKGTDQTARMRRLVCTFAFANPPRWVVFFANPRRWVFLRGGPYKVPIPK